MELEVPMPIYTKPIEAFVSFFIFLFSFFLRGMGVGMARKGGGGWLITMFLDFNVGHSNVANTIYQPLSQKKLENPNIGHSTH